MTAGLMRRITVSRIRAPKSTGKTPTPSHIISSTFRQPRRNLANIRERDRAFSETWFTKTIPNLSPLEPGQDSKIPDERTLNLGKTIRILHERLSTLLASPLPQEILSPQITLRLFPSTHPHLPTVTGKLAYTAALWTAPMAWGRVPVVGNIRLIILSERMVKNGGNSTPADYRNEKLIVRWKTCGKTKDKGTGGTYRGISASEQVDKITEWLRGEKGSDQGDGEFCGLFIFEFDEEGRILTHTIEHAEEGNSWDSMTRMISVTDWLLGKAWGKKSEDCEPGLALGYCHAEGRRRAHIKNLGRDRDR